MKEFKFDFDFLKELTSTPSPSGMEQNIQKKWMSYISKNAKEEMKNGSVKVENDTIGNAYAIVNPKANFTVLIAAHCDEVGYMVTKVEDNGFIRFAEVGGPVFEALPGTHMSVLGNDKVYSGIVGIKAGHHGGLEGKLKISDLYIDCGAESAEALENKIETGTFLVSQIEPTNLLNNLFTARGLDNRVSLFMLSQCFLMTRSLKLNVRVIFASTINEEVGADGARAAVKRYEPDVVLGCDGTFANDYPDHGNDAQPDCSLGKGPVLSHSSKVSAKINKAFKSIACELKMPLQAEVLPGRTGTDIDRVRAVSNGHCALVSIPMRYMHSPVEVVSLDDVEMTAKLISSFLVSLDGKDNFCPIS